MDLSCHEAPDSLTLKGDSVGQQTAACAADMRGDSQQAVERLPEICSDNHARVLGDLLRQETKQMPQTNYIEQQPFFTAQHRLFLVQWMHSACYCLRLSFSTFAISVRLLDRVLSACAIVEQPSEDMQLAAVACLSIAAKLNGPDNMVSSVAEYQVQTALWKTAFTAAEITDMELQVLTLLDWQPTSATAVDFLDRLLCLANVGRDEKGRLREDGLAITIRNKAVHQIFQSLHEDLYIALRPSCVAAAAILAAMRESSAFMRTDILDVFYCFAAHLDQEHLRYCTAEFTNDAADVQPSRSGSYSDDYSEAASIAALAAKQGCMCLKASKESPTSVLATAAVLDDPAFVVRASIVAHL